MSNEDLHLDFAKKTAKMRDLQKIYFKNRNGANLARAKAAEKEVDDFLKIYHPVVNTQATIF